MSTSKQNLLDENNSNFWNELCGTGLAEHLGIKDHTPESIARFDEAYFDIYPYLKGYFPESLVRGKRVLEIGLGYGTLSQFLMEGGAKYSGLDISPGPVAMVRERMRLLGLDGEEDVKVGSALAMPFADDYFDTLVSIGCLHHTGDLQSSIDEAFRVLKPGGTAVIMIYNLRSYRQFLYRFFRWADALDKRYDSNRDGAAAPHIDYTSPQELKTLFGKFTSLSWDIQNCDGISILGGFTRKLLLGNLARIVGLDLYITAVK